MENNPRQRLPLRARIVLRVTGKTEREKKNVISEKMSVYANTSCSLQEVICHGILRDSLRDHLVLLVSNISFHILLSITATFENLLVLVAIWRTSSLHSPSNTLLFGLALSGLCVACVAQPGFIALQFLVYNNDGLRSCILDKAAIFLNIFSSKVTLLTLTAISIDRYLAVYLHLRYREIITNRKIKLLLPALWMVGGAIAATSFLAITVLQWTLIIVESACFSTSLFVWIRIYQVIRRHKAQIQCQAQTQEQHFNMAKFKKSASNCMFLMFAYLLCYLPLFIATVRLTINLNKSNFRLVFVSYTAFVLNSSLNPLVYCWRHQGIRAVVKQILKNICCQVQDH